jgi:hypothetical protein
MKVEDMIGKVKANIESTDDFQPHDIIGNPLHEGDWVVVGWSNVGPLFGKVLKITKGGIETPQGTTPTVTLIQTQLILHSGSKKKGDHRLGQVAKSMNPLSQPLVEAIASMDLPVRS